MTFFLCFFEDLFGFVDYQVGGTYEWYTWLDVKTNVRFKVE